MNSNFDFEKETKRLIMSIGKEQLKDVFNWEYCELDYSFVGFIDKYATLNIPKDFTVIDIGCYQAVQAYYFKDYKQYIGVEPEVPIEYRLKQANAIYYQQTAQEFIRTTLPDLIKNGLLLNKTFAICSAVPDEEAQKLVSITFPYNRVTYPMKGIDTLSEHLPYLNSCRLQN